MVLTKPAEFNLLNQNQFVSKSFDGKGALMAALQAPVLGQ